MLYIFNSGFRLGYQKNVLNTLFLPPGGTNDYRYRYTGDGSIHIAPESLDALSATSPGEHATIIFIDRFAKEGYFFHPIRQGKLVSTGKDGERLFFRVSLEQYIYPQDIFIFNDLIKQELRNSGLPQLTNNEPGETNDGRYAFKDNDVFLDKSRFLFGEAAYAQIVGHLQKTRAFEDSVEDGKQRETIFVKTRILKDGKEQRPATRNNNAVFEIEARKSYTLSVSYFFPAQRLDTSKTAQIHIHFGDSLHSPAFGPVQIATYENRSEILFTGGVEGIYIDDGISFDYLCLDKNIELLTHNPEKILQTRVKEEKWFWAKWLGLLLAFAISGLLASFDQTRATSLNLTLTEQFIVGINIIGFVIQGLVIYTGLRFSGRKLL